MKKYLVITAFLTLAFNCLYAQSAYYDALKLRSLIVTDNKGRHFNTKPDSLLKAGNILYNYMKLDKKIDSINWHVIHDEFTSDPNFNPFLTPLIPNSPNSGNEPKSSGSSLSLQSIGNLDVTNFADGLAKFLVKRTKQELATAFFERFKDKLDSIKQLRILFPTTYRALSAIDQEIYNYAAYVDLLRESFQKDLAMILPNFALLVQDPSMQPVFKALPYLKTIMLDGLFLINEFNEGKHPGEAFHDYIAERADTTLNLINKNIYPSLQILDIFSQSLRSGAKDKYWISADSLKLLFKDKITFQIYMGLVYQQLTNKDIVFYDKEGKMVDFKAFLTKHAAEIVQDEERYNSYLSDLIQKANEADKYFIVIKQLIQKGQDKPTYQDYYSLYNSALTLFEQLLPTPTLLNLKTNITMNVIDRNEDKVHKYLSVAHSLGNIYVDIYEKQYPSAVIEASTILDLLPGNPSNLSQLYIKYGNFASVLAKAQNSDEVEEAIEAVAMPAGASTVKRESEFNVSLNAYVGPYLGYEKIHGIDTKKMGAFGVTAPVGIAVSWGHRLLFFPTGNSKWSTSLFVSLIDIGALTSYRFSSAGSKVGTDSTAQVAQVPRIQLKDIISPGAFVSIGIPRTPISFSGGFQLAPNFRNVSLSTNNTVINGYGDNKLYTRWSFSILVDIPLLNFYTKDRNP